MVSDNPRSFETFLVGKLVILFLFPSFLFFGTHQHRSNSWSALWPCTLNTQRSFPSHCAWAPHVIRMDSYRNSKMLATVAIWGCVISWKNSKRNTDQPMSLIHRLASLLFDQNDSFVDTLGRVADMVTSQWKG